MDKGAVGGGATWLDRHLSEVTVEKRRNLRYAVVATALGLILLSGAAGFACAATGFPTTGPLAPDASAALTMAASLLTVLGLVPALRRRDLQSARDMSTIATHKIEMLALLGKLTELHDPDTNGHNLRVALYALTFGEHLRVPPQVLVRLCKGALLHDIGKIAVPERILAKPGPLDPDEVAIMREHVRHGAAMVAQTAFTRDATAVVFGHHERFDGAGYPRRLRGHAIPFEARAFAIIDVFDALTSRRAYKPALDPTRVLEIMADGRGSHFDPTLLDQFMPLAAHLEDQIPDTEEAQLRLLQQRMLAYFDRLMHVDVETIGSPAESAP